MSDEVEIGIPEVDAQHAAIFAQQAEVERLLGDEATEDRAALAAAVDALESRLRAHLAFEIELMAETHYADRDGHATRHAAILDTFLAIAERIRAQGATPFNRAAFRMDIAQAFAAHVRNCDQRFAHDLTRAD